MDNGHTGDQNVNVIVFMQIQYQEQMDTQVSGGVEKMVLYSRWVEMIQQRFSEKTNITVQAWHRRRMRRGQGRGHVINNLANGKVTYKRVPACDFQLIKEDAT